MQFLMYLSWKGYTNDNTDGKELQILLTINKVHVLPANVLSFLRILLGEDTKNTENVRLRNYK